MSIRVLLQNDLDCDGLHKAIDKTIAQLAAGDFRSAEVKKMAGHNLFRAKLNYADRLLFALGRFGAESVLLVLEVIRNHAYDKSRFLRGAVIDSDNFSDIATLDEIEQQAPDPLRLGYLNPESPRFHFLDKILSFDDQQDAILKTQPPVIIIGSAGSGKTTLTLEKLKSLRGDVLYTTLSSFLTQNARDLYYSHHYQNEHQEVTFLSFRELLETVRVPGNKEIRFRDFEKWFALQRGASKLRDPHKLFEEINGVLTGCITTKEYLSREEYHELGVRQSIFTPEERDEVYTLFERYLRMLEKDGFYDPNILAQQYIDNVTPEYDFIVVDEIQDLTNTQLSLILRFLKQWDAFVLCGDSNQIVHPNFFSWSALKQLFYQERLGAGAKPREITRILVHNYRNSQGVTALANRLLLIKNARFGSIDRESNYLVTSTGTETGAIELLRAQEGTLREIDQRTRRSAQTAILVPRNEDKEAARKFFKTPLLFSIQEAKGLEYRNIVLLNFVTAFRDEFNAITEGVTADHVNKSELRYARGKDKRDKSLEQYKFFINSLYVALTRAVQNIYILEQDTSHQLFGLLELRTVLDKTSARTEQSSTEDWKREAKRLEAQGKQDQAAAIRREILGTRDVEWPVYTAENFSALKAEALDDKNYNKKAKKQLYEFADYYGHFDIIQQLRKKKFVREKDSLFPSSDVLRSITIDYFGKPTKAILHKLEKYGPNFRNPLNQTPLMIAAKLGDLELIESLIEAGADRELIDNMGMTPLRVAFVEALSNEQFRSFRFGEIYPLLAPSHLKLRINDRLIKLDAGRMEYIMLQTLLAYYAIKMRYHEIFAVPSILNAWCLSPKEITQLMGLLPDSILPERRKSRPYISAILAKNEIDRDSPYNRRLFVRMRHGVYTLNPCIDFAIQDQWISMFDLLHTNFMVEEGGLHQNRTIANLMYLVRKTIEAGQTLPQWYALIQILSGDRRYKAIVEAPAEPPAPQTAKERRAQLLREQQALLKERERTLRMQQGLNHPQLKPKQQFIQDLFDFENE